MEIVFVTSNNSQQLRLRSLDHPSPITVRLGYSKVLGTNVLYPYNEFAIIFIANLQYTCFLQQTISFVN